MSNNLTAQWNNEIHKHTTGLKVLVLVGSAAIPPVTLLLTYDIILFSQTRFERIERDTRMEGLYCPLEYIRLKRCIIDEGHRRTWVPRAIETLLLRFLLHS